MPENDNPSDSRELAKYAALTTPELLQLIGSEIAETAQFDHAGSPEPAELLAKGKIWFTGQLKQLQNIVCTERVLGYADKYRDEQTLIALLLDGIASLKLGVSPFVITVLCLRIGITRFCSLGSDIQSAEAQFEEAIASPHLALENPACPMFPQYITAEYARDSAYRSQFLGKRLQEIHENNLIWLPDDVICALPTLVFESNPHASLNALVRREGEAFYIEVNEALHQALQVVCMAYSLGEPYDFDVEGRKALGVEWISDELRSSYILKAVRLAAEERVDELAEFQQWLLNDHDLFDEDVVGYRLVYIAEIVTACVSFVICHELAHVICGHLADSHGFARSLSPRLEAVLNERCRAQEFEADHLAGQMMYEMCTKADREIFQFIRSGQQSVADNRPHNNLYLNLPQVVAAPEVLFSLIAAIEFEKTHEASQTRSHPTPVQRLDQLGLRARLQKDHPGVVVGDAFPLAQMIVEAGGAAG